MPVQCTACQGSGKQDEVRDEYGNTASCPECGGLGTEPILAEALARLEAAEARQDAELGALATELRTALGKLGAVLRPDHIRIVRNADGLDVLV